MTVGGNWNKCLVIGDASRNSSLTRCRHARKQRRFVFPQQEKELALIQVLGLRQVHWVDEFLANLCLVVFVGPVGFAVVLEAVYKSGNGFWHGHGPPGKRVQLGITNESWEAWDGSGATWVCRSKRPSMGNFQGRTVFYPVPWRVR